MTDAFTNDEDGASPNRMQRRSLRTRGRLLKAALGVFSEKGVEAATIEDITERADLGKGTFYRYFTGKEDVVVALTDESVARLIDEIRKATASRASLQEVLEALLRAHVAAFMTRREEFLLLFQGRLLLKLEREDASGLEKSFIDYLRVLEQQVSPFMPPPVDAAKVRRVACGLAGFVSGYLSFAMIGLPERDIEAGFGPLRNAFVTGCAAFLAGSPPAAAPVASAGLGKDQKIA